MPARPTIEDARAMRWTLNGLHSVRRQLRDVPVTRVHAKCHEARFVEILRLSPR